MALLVEPYWILVLGARYISSILGRALKKPPIRTDYKQIETMLHTTNTLIDIYDMEITKTKK